MLGVQFVGRSLDATRLRPIGGHARVLLVATLLVALGLLAIGAHARAEQVRMHHTFSRASSVITGLYIRLKFTNNSNSILTFTKETGLEGSWFVPPPKTINIGETVEIVSAPGGSFEGTEFRLNYQLANGAEFSMYFDDPFFTLSGCGNSYEFNKTPQGYGFNRKHNCGKEPAEFVVSFYEGADQWDLASINGRDANGLPSNPAWGWQLTGEPIDSVTGGEFEPSCVRFGGCTTQTTSEDRPAPRWYQYIPLVGPVVSAFVCDGGKGHVNWSDATYNGLIYFDKHDGGPGGDDDYNMALKTAKAKDGYALGTSNGNTGNNADILMEFDSDETIDRFVKPSIWNTYHEAVDNHPFPDFGSLNDYIDGHEAVVTGLMGFDAVHPPDHVELHPVHALAIREEENPLVKTPGHDRWAIFVRNWGDEGFCSSQQHDLNTRQITLKLPPRPKAPGPLVASSEQDTRLYHVKGDGNFSVWQGAGDGAQVTFDLPPPGEEGYWYGELDLEWTDPPVSQSRPAAHPLTAAQRLAAARAAARRQALLRKRRAWLRRHRARLRKLALSPSRSRRSGRHVPLASATATSEDVEPEQTLKEVYEALSPMQQEAARTLYNALTPALSPPVSSLGEGHVAAGPPPPPATVPAVTERPATASVLRNESRVRALCAAAEGNLPSEAGACAALNLPPVTTLGTSGGPPMVSGWDTTTVTATLTAHDATGSGIAFTQYSTDGQIWTDYTGPFTLPDGIYTLSFRSQDNKGNLEETRSQTFRIDTEPPNIAINQPQATNYIHSTTLTLNYSVTDGNGQATGVGAGSGVASVTPTMDGVTTLSGHGLQSGQIINLLTEMSVGPHTFTVTATDNVGDTASQAVTFAIVVTPQSIIEDVEAFYAAGRITQDDARSLLAKLENAARRWAAGNCQAASGMYYAFINELQAQSGKHVYPAAASIMIADATYLVSQCPASGAGVITGQAPPSLQGAQIRALTDWPERGATA